MKVSLKALRVNANMNQKKASKLIGITSKTLQNWESGATFPNGAQLIKLCRIYECSLNDIFLPDSLAKS